MTDLPHRRYPCAECPFRRDTEPGMFPASRYEALRSTVGDPAPPGAPVFACHKTSEGKDQVCAGWLAVTGWGHVGIRLALARGELPVEAMEPGEDWPELFSSYEKMAEVQGG